MARLLEFVLDDSDIATSGLAAGDGPHARTDAAHERLELGGLNGRLFVDGADHVLGE